MIGDVSADGILIVQELLLLLTWIDIQTHSSLKVKDGLLPSIAQFTSFYLESTT